MYPTIHYISRHSPICKKKGKFNIIQNTDIFGQYPWLSWFFFSFVLFVLLVFVLCPMSPMPLDSIFLIEPSVFHDIYSKGEPHLHVAYMGLLQNIITKFEITLA
jgi:hypothetical protein